VPDGAFDALSLEITPGPALEFALRTAGALSLFACGAELHPARSVAETMSAVNFIQNECGRNFPRDRTPYDTELAGLLKSLLFARTRSRDG
jgi:hypothetical protein